MKKLFKTFSKITNVICQLILIAGCFWLIKNQNGTPIPVDLFNRGYDQEMSSDEAPMSTAAGSSTRMMKSAAPSVMNEALADDIKPQAKIIKNGNINLEVQDLKEAKEKIVSFLPEFKAYIQNENEGKSTDSWHASMTIKVPAQHFDALVNKISDAGYNVENKSVQLSDVTERYIDLEARLKNKRLLIEKYTALLKQSQKIADTIEINRQLESVGSELESLEGQMKFLNHLIDLSTLDVSLVKRLVPTEKNKNFFDDFKYQISAGFNAFRSTILFIIGLWPFVMATIVGIIIYRRWFRKP